jgi:hypothetical protein
MRNLMDADLELLPGPEMDFMPRLAILLRIFPSEAGRRFECLEKKRKEKKNERALLGQ